MIYYHGRGPERSSPVKIFIATPAYSGLSAAYTTSIFNAMRELETSGIGCELAIYSGNCHVDDGRNALVKDFLKSDCTDLVFIDADLWFTGQDLVKLAQHKRDVVAGVYPKKQDDEIYPVWFCPGELRTDSEGLLEVLAVPTGFLKISRNAIESVANVVPKYAPNQNKPADTPLIFERKLNGATRVGGDYEFCRKWLSIGGKIYVDPDMEFTHVGENGWSGSLATYLLRKNGMTNDLIRSMIIKLSKGKTVSFEKLFKEWGNPWSANPEYLATAYMFAQEAYTPIIECGSGLSTLVIGAATKQPIYVLEQDYDHAHKTQEWVSKMGWNHVYVYHAPLMNYGKWWWYETPDLPSTGLVFCDGPRRQDGRYGLYPTLYNEMAQGCKILMDDYDTEKEVLEQWGLPYHKIGENIAVAEVAK